MKLLNRIKKSASERSETDKTPEEKEAKTRRGFLRLKKKKKNTAVGESDYTESENALSATGVTSIESRTDAPNKPEPEGTIQEQRSVEPESSEQKVSAQPENSEQAEKTTEPVTVEGSATAEKGEDVAAAALSHDETEPGEPKTVYTEEENVTEPVQSANGEEHEGDDKEVEKPDHTRELEVVEPEEQNTGMLCGCF